MTTSDKGLDLIKKFEGLRLKAYKPVATEKYFTIGYGHYGQDVAWGMEIDEKRATALLKQDVAVAERCLNNLGVRFTQNQFDALVSWVFNLGTGSFARSTLRKRIIMKMSPELVAAEIIKWVNSGGRPLLGLKRRRIAEANMYLGRQKYRIVGQKIVG